MLKKFLCDLASVLTIEGLGFDEDLSYEEMCVEILDIQVRWLRNNEVPTLKVLWRNNLVRCVMWEAEAEIISRYPYLFRS